MTVIEVCRVCHRSNGGGPSLILGRLAAPCQTCSPPTGDDHETIVRHADSWCSGLCRELDIRAARALVEHERMLERELAGLASELDLARSRYVLRLAFLHLDELAWPGGVGEARAAFRSDVESGYLVAPDPPAAQESEPTKRGSPEWKARVQEGRRRRRAA